MKTQYVVALVSILSLAGCSSPSPTKESIAQDEAKAMAVKTAAGQQADAAVQVRMESEVKQIPPWALDPPRPDAGGIYAVGMAEGDKVRIALKKATLEAEYGLAKLYKQEISGSERGYLQERGERGATTEQYTALIDKLVTQVPVVGFEVVQQEVKPINGLYHAFILLKLPYDEFNKVVQQQKREATDATIVAAFDDLDRRVRQRQADRLQEAEQKHRQKMTELQQRQSMLQPTAIPSAPSAAPVTPGDGGVTAAVVSAAN